MLCQWRVRKKGQEANPYEDYREFPSWKVTSMLQGLGYETLYGLLLKKPNSELENGLVELVVDKDVYEMLMYVDKFKVIELYTDHTVKKQHVLTQEPLATIIDVTQPDSSSGNEAEVDVSEDEWLRESLKKLPIKSKKGQQSSRKEVGQSSRNGSGSENDSGFDQILRVKEKKERVYKEDFFLGEQFATSKLVKDKVTRVSVEQRRQLSLKKNDKLRVRVVCKGQVPDFANNDMGSVIPFTGDQNGPISKVKPKSISKKEKVAKPRESYACPWAMQVSKLPNEDTWEVRTLKDTHTLDPQQWDLSTCICCIESESKDSWKWFLDCLGDDLELFGNSNFTFISDRQKEILRNVPLASTIPERFDKRMEEMKNHNLEAYEWLRKIPPQHWARSHFTGREKSNILLITCVEWNGSDLYQVTCPWGDQFVVNLSERSLIVLPVHWLTTWKEMYKFKINPVNGPQGWKKSDVPTTIIPPKPHPQIGRPPKKRKKSAAELADEMMKSKKLTKTGKSVTCKSCKQVGHNSRGCKSKKGGGSQQAGVAGHGRCCSWFTTSWCSWFTNQTSTPQASVSYILVMC
ncbi:hypothetical protein Tco_1370275 [Tanacetum coccineum]